MEKYRNVKAAVSLIRFSQYNNQCYQAIIEVDDSLTWKDVLRISVQKGLFNNYIDENSQ